MAVSDCFGWLTISILNGAQTHSALQKDTCEESTSAFVPFLPLPFKLNTQNKALSSAALKCQLRHSNNACIVTVFLCNYHEQVGLGSAPPHWLNSVLLAHCDTVLAVSVRSRSAISPTLNLQATRGFLFPWEHQLIIKTCLMTAA